jgi:hypothetical protein
MGKVLKIKILWQGCIEKTRICSGNYDKKKVKRQITKIISNHYFNNWGLSNNIQIGNMNSFIERFQQ